MGEYFDWVNVDRKEYLSPSDFDLGNKRYETVGKDNDLLRALQDLLSNEWKGCRIIFLGDECEAPQDVATDLFQTIQKHSEELGYSGEDMYEMIWESYKDVAGLFKAAEDDVREEIRIYLERLKEGDSSAVNEYGIDIDDPYKGLFLRAGKTFKYTINHTKKVAYSLDKTKILYQNGEMCKSVDPLPILMGYGRSLKPGVWLGDIISVDDILPEGYTLIPEIHLDW
ncbi:MAG: hypothetical protein IKE31_08630 [Eubacterium sp.]|nr:hypothetical protein [Eubacterium sp.]MBR3361180.1 hypothetical protein [Lachnospiraceae bacterium]